MRHVTSLCAASFAIVALCSCGGGDGGPPPLSITAFSPPAGTTGVPYAGYVFAATGGAPPLTWTEAGVLPPGLALSAAGQLSGDPNTAGAYALTVTVTDSSMPPRTASAHINLHVNDSPITIAPGSPPEGTVNYAYAFGFTAQGGSPPYSWTQSGALPPGLSLENDGTVSGTPTQTGTFAFSVTATDSAQQPMSSPPLATKIVILSGFTNASGHMLISRSGHAAALLLSGKVLVTGGGAGLADSTAELYDPATQTFSSTAGKMTEARIRHTATLLKLNDAAAANYGKVLIVGSGDVTAELYDPVSDTFAATGSLNHARSSPTATLLKSGKVLIVGGSTTADDATTELYDPMSGTFTFTGSTTVVRSGHTATLLLDGSVLIAGGTGAPSAELYDPTHGTFTATTGDMTMARSGHTATLLGTAADATENGFVLLVGPYGSAEVYDPSTQTFQAVGGLGGVGAGSTASLRDDGSVLISGGSRFQRCGRIFVGPISTSQSALFSPDNNSFAGTGQLNTVRDSHTATVLQDGTVLIVGGTHHALYSYPRPCLRVPIPLASAELFK